MASLVQIPTELQVEYESFCQQFNAFQLKQSSLGSSLVPTFGDAIPDHSSLATQYSTVLQDDMLADVDDDHVMSSSSYSEALCCPHEDMVAAIDDDHENVIDDVEVTLSPISLSATQASSYDSEALCRPHEDMVDAIAHLAALTSGAKIRQHLAGKCKWPHWEHLNKIRTGMKLVAEEWGTQLNKLTLPTSDDEATAYGLGGGPDYWKPFDPLSIVLPSLLISLRFFEKISKKYMAGIAQSRSTQ